MRKILAVLILGCAAVCGAQVIGLTPTPQAVYFWNTATSNWAPCPNTSTAEPFASTPQAFVQEGFNTGLGQWTPSTSCPGGLNTGLTSFQGRTDANAVLLLSDVNVKLLTATNCNVIGNYAYSPVSNSCIFVGGGGGGGSVVSVGLTAPTSLFTTSGTNPITVSGTFALALTNAAQNSVWAGPPTGGAGTPSYQTAPTFSAANLTSVPACATCILGTTGSSYNGVVPVTQGGIFTQLASNFNVSSALTGSGFEEIYTSNGNAIFTPDCIYLGGTGLSCGISGSAYAFATGKCAGCGAGFHARDTVAEAYSPGGNDVWVSNDVSEEFGIFMGVTSSASGGTGLFAPSSAHIFTEFDNLDIHIAGKSIDFRGNAGSAALSAFCIGCGGVQNVSLPLLGSTSSGFLVSAATTGLVSNATTAQQTITINSTACVLGGSCTISVGGPTLQTNTVNNASQALLNFTTSTANTVGLTATPVNTSGGIEKIEITGASYTGNAATSTNLASYPTLCTAGQFSLGLSSGSNNCSTPTTGITFPQTVGGTTTSGGIPYFSSTTVLTSSALLPTGDFVLGGGAGGAPTASFSVVPVANGGSGAGTFTIHGVLLGQTTGAFHVTAAGASNAVFMGQGAADPIFVAQPVIDCTNCTNVPSSTPAYPQTVTGCVSGGILYGSLSTQVTCSPAGTAGQVVLWGGAGTAPGAQAIGTSGATLPLLNGANTWSGQQTYAAPIVSSLIPGSSSSEILFEGAPFSGGSGTTTFPLMLASPGAGPTTWSTGGTFFGVSSQSGFAGNFLDFHVNGGASVAKVDSAGASTNSNVTDSALTQGQQVVAGTSGLLSNGGTAILACADTSASGTAQTCTTSPSFTPAANSCVIYTTTTANSGTGLTLNVNSLGAKSVAKWLGTATLAAGDVAATSPQLACYNGTVWNLSTIGNAPSGGGGGLSGMTAGQIPVATTATTVTSSKGLGGSNTLIATIAAIGSSGVAIVSDGSNGIASSGLFLSAFANTTANNSFSGYVQQTVMPRYTVATVASATTIAPTTPLVIISGTTTVTTITAPSGTAALIGAAFDMITSSAVLFNTGGNIATAFTSQPGLQYHCAFMGTTNGLWYCQDINTVLRGNITLTTATSDALTITGVTTASVCSFDATNSTAAGITTTLAGFYTVTANTFTLNHAATVAAGATYGVICTVD